MYMYIHCMLPVPQSVVVWVGQDECKIHTLGLAEGDTSITATAQGPTCAYSAQDIHLRIVIHWQNDQIQVLRVIKVG